MDSPYHSHEVTYDLVNTQHIRQQHLLAAEGEELSRQRGSAVRALLYQLDVGVAGMLGLDAPHHALGAPDDDREEVVEVVGDASGQPANRLHLLRLEELDLELGLRLVRLQALGDVP